MKILVCDVCMRENKIKEAFYIRFIVAAYNPKMKKWRYYNSIYFKPQLCEDHLKQLIEKLKDKVGEVTKEIGI